MPLRFPVMLLATAVVLASARAADPLDPADPALNPKGRAILAWFQQLQAAPDLRLVSGQFAGWSGTASLAELARIETATGKWPAMIGLDYCTFVEGQAAIGIAPVNALARTYWHAGGLVNLSWHAPNPANPHGGGLRDQDVDLAEILTPGRPSHARWLKMLDEVAAGLQDLQADGIVVIWRPLHEMNGGWFWWGAKDPAAFIALWRHMFDYFTKTKGLHNLIWAFSPNHGQRPATDYYPGDAYVDLVGLDAYTDHVDPEHIKGFERLGTIRKPVGLTEYGPHGASNPPGDYDFRRLTNGIATHFPQLRHFLVWNDGWNPASNRFAREFYQDPRILSRTDLPPGLAGP
jgi:mannan endo-1,4-beta-mannosidase